MTKAQHIKGKEGIDLDVKYTCVKNERKKYQKKERNEEIKLRNEVKICQRDITKGFWIFEYQIIKP